ncbi:hypothetical protein KP509_1Z069600 [Ceratopteris richardii]|nr:hypothetical protein KP509_1Z069600 [Ceratopteris richardii]
MVVSLRGRSVSARLLGFSLSSPPSYLRSSQSCRSVPMAVRACPAIFGHLTYSRSTCSRIRLCYFHCKRLVSAPSRKSFPIRSIMTQRQDISSGAPHTEDEPAVLAKLQDLKLADRTFRKGDSRRILCPECQGGNSGEISLSLSISADGLNAKWICFRSSCGFRGYTEEPTGILKANHQQKGRQYNALQRNPIEGNAQLMDLSEQQFGYMKVLGITEQTINRNGIKQLRQGSNSLLAFPYKNGGQVVSYRFYNHNFESEEESPPQTTFFGLDDIVGASQVIIVAHEMDKLALEEAGFLNCVSIPDVPHRTKSPLERRRKTEPVLNDEKFKYLLNCEEHLGKVESFILALGSSDECKDLAEELARRLGKERCYRVNWPMDEDSESLCKDPAEVLKLKGPQALSDMIASAELFPIHGLFQFREYEKLIEDYYWERSGNEQGVSSGWKSLDPFYRVVPGELTLITGVPGSGKSEWIDALMCNLNRQKKWTFALCSMENQVKEHGRKLLEKFLGKPFLSASYSNGFKRMSEKEYEQGKLWLSKTFFLIRHEDDELPSIEWVLDVAKSAVMRYGIRGLVIDPYNELDHQRPPHMTETEYVSQILSKVKRFAQHHECHVWFVAHPKQLHNWRGEAPSLYDVSGSAHFINKCDVGIVVHRNRDPSMGPMDQVQILVRKVRNKAAGVIGEAVLNYNRVTGEYMDCPA